MNVTLITLNGPPLIGRSSAVPTFIRASNFNFNGLRGRISRQSSERLQLTNVEK